MGMIHPREHQRFWLFQSNFLHSVLCSICKAMVAPLGRVLVLNDLQLPVTQPWPRVFAQRYARNRHVAEQAGFPFQRICPNSECTSGLQM